MPVQQGSVELLQHPASKELLQSLKSGRKSYPAFFMSGNGGNKVVAIPALDVAVVITSTNYNTHGMHEQTEKILTDYVLAAVD
jgi:hypothetical protein